MNNQVILADLTIRTGKCDSHVIQKLDFDDVITSQTHTQSSLLKKRLSLGFWLKKHRTCNYLLCNILHEFLPHRLWWECVFIP